ncbi:hypothetical protein [Snodgrassella alvi]|uniref:hypothetical protein n=1 Tax=Snodgrassella alvi TaxID=1196083 RepID=UPI003513FE80
MKRKQKLSFERFNGLLSNITLVDEKVDYLSYHSQEVCKNVTAYEAYQLMAFHQPKWLTGLFKIRDFLGKESESIQLIDSINWKKQSRT